MRNATWRSHVLRPMRPCMSCNGQLDLGLVPLDRQGLLDDPDYIRNSGRSDLPTSQNVAPLSVSVAASLLAQYVSFSVAPAGLGDPGPLRYTLSSHYLEHLKRTTRPHCPVELAEGIGDDAPISPAVINKPNSFDNSRVLQTLRRVFSDGLTSDSKP